MLHAHFRVKVVSDTLNNLGNACTRTKHHKLTEELKHIYHGINIPKNQNTLKFKAKTETQYVIWKKKQKKNAMQPKHRVTFKYKVIETRMTITRPSLGSFPLSR